MASIFTVIPTEKALRLVMALERYRFLSQKAGLNIVELREMEEITYAMNRVAEAAGPFLGLLPAWQEGPGIKL